MGDSSKYITGLLENAYAFFQESLADLESKEKNSIIHFCTALELILKARLL